MKFNSEREFEIYIRGLLEKHFTSTETLIYALTNKKAVDIVIAHEGKEPKLFFIEVKYHINNHGRLGFGGGAGGGFQPEILIKRPKYFEKHLRWILASEDTETILFLDNDTIVKYVSGGVVGQKLNNIQKKIFKEQKGLTENELIDRLREWLTR